MILIRTLRGCFLNWVVLVLVGATLMSSACQGDSSTASPTVNLEHGASPVVVSSPSFLPPTVTKALTPSPTLSHPPQFDDLRFVFVRGQELWLWSADEESRMIAPAPIYRPMLSPDGHFVAYQRPVSEAYSTLWIVNLETNQAWEAVSIEDLQTIGGGALSPGAIGIMPYQVAWKPTVNELVFNTQQVAPGPGLTLLDDLNVYDVDEQTLHFLLLVGWGGMFAFSPEGQSVAISTPTQVILANADGSTYRVVLQYALVNTYSDYRFYARPVWSPRGYEFLVAIPPDHPLADPPQPTELWRITLENEVQKVAEVISVPFFDTPIAISPTLLHFAFIQEEDEASKRVLYIADMKSGQPIAYAEDQLLLFWGWSPDGEHFVFSTGEDQFMWLGKVDQPETPLNRQPYGLINLRWLDATRFAYVRAEEHRLSLYLGDIYGGEVLIAAGIDSPFQYDGVLLER